MNLDDFEKQIDLKIVGRGYEYFLDDLVEGPEFLGDGVWLATVYGSESYRVEIHTDPENSRSIRDWRCNCPYDYGPVCKHVVAVLYAMTGPEHQEPDSSNKKKKTEPKDHIRKIFKNTNREDLQEFILTCITSMDGFGNRFLAHFADRLDEDPVPRYRNIIRNYAKAAGDRYGFIDYRSAPTLTQPLWDLNQKADKLLDAGNIRESMAVCQILIEEVAGFIGQMDDSDGGAGEVIMRAFNTLNSMTGSVSSKIKEELFGWCIQELPLQKYHDSGFESHFLGLLPQLVSSVKQEEQFFDVLDRQIEREKGNGWSDFHVTQLIEAKINYLKGQKRDREILKLLKRYNRFPDFREQLVDRAVGEKDFDTAKNLCREGINIAGEKGHPGTVARWQKKLFQIARTEGDVPEIRKWSETLFFESFDSMKWYRALKATYPKKEWAGRCEELISNIKGPNQRGGYRHANTLAQIFVEEGYTDRLLNLVRQNVHDISFVDRYADALAKEFVYELPELYEPGIREVVRQTGRKQYRQAAGWLRKMKKLTYGEEPAYALFIQLLNKYNNRPAMKEEFEKAFPEWRK